MSVLVALGCLPGQAFVPPLVSGGCELSVNAHGPFAPHCSELCSPTSSRPAPGLVSSVQHQGLTEQWGEMWRGSDSGSCWSCPLEPLTPPAGAGFAPFRLKCERFITAPLWQFGTGKDFLCKLPWFYTVRILPPELDRADCCVTAYLAVMSLMSWVNQKSNSKSVLQTPLRNCSGLGAMWVWFFPLRCCSVANLPGTWKPLVCPLASHDLTVMETEVNDDVCDGKWGGCVAKTTCEEPNAKSRFPCNFLCRECLLLLYLKQWPA